MRQRAIDFIRASAREGEILVLGPSTEASRDLARRACETALVGVHAFSLKQYARDLTRSSTTPINNIVHQAICARISHTEKLTYLGPVARMPGFPKALARTIRELRLQQVRPNGDAGVLLQAYERELDSRQLADDAATYHLASASARPEMPALLFAIDGRTAAERHFAASLTPSTGFDIDIPEDPGNALQSLQRYLFSEETAPTRNVDETFHAFAASTEAQECLEIARRIVQLALAGSRLDECAVLLRQPERYAPLLTEAFRRAGIPIWLAQGSRQPDLAGRALLTLLHCVQEGLSASRMGEYLSLRQVPEFNPSSWEHWISNAHVIGGVDRWARRLSAIARNSEALEELKDFVLPLVERLDKLPKKALWRDWMDELCVLAESSLREPSNILDSLDELQPMSDIGPVSIDEVLLLLSQHLRATRDRDEESRYGRVWVGSIEAAHGLSFRHVFVPGVAEGAFPRPLREDPLLLNEQRRALGLPEVTEEDEQRLLLLASRCATDSITLSYGRIDLETGRPRVPSLYLYAALRAAGGATEIESATWPGSDPVDDYEYDSIALHDRTAGAGAYLKRANARLYDSLLARYRRWEPDKKWQSSDGLNILDPALEEYRLTQEVYSVSALETYAACPYQFYLRAMMGLKPVERPEPLPRMDPAVRGAIFHRVQLELLRALKAASLLPLNTQKLPIALSLLNGVISRVGEEEAERLVPATPQVWRDELSRMRADLRGWVSKMAIDDDGWTPFAFELAFGRRKDAGHDDRSVEEPVLVLEDYLVQGSIDLVERHTGGLLRVTDHKTGSYPESVPRTIGKGEVLQPSLYMLAASKILAEPVSSARLYYATLRANFRSIPIMVPNPAIGHVLKTIDHSISSGLLPANPREGACEHCDYRCICGPYEEQRVKRKPKQTDLERIRSTE
jgi:CRISPR/Cas system-associated exonuclease Cas4 (RecB family)